ncbi:MAG: OmpA family protein [Desulfohalobiaceae bacterium]|nr:OmpA family protein [Desulfohalobiaceae bacterium]
MRRIVWLVLVAGILVFVGSGCARYGTPPEVAETKDLLEEARMAGANENCPQEYKEARAAWEKAERLCPCNKQKAKAQAEKARAMAAQLCTDTDGDGVPDEMDQCPDTPAGVEVDEVGCARVLDSDGDGVNDPQDECPDTPDGVEVDAVGCPLDSDGDGISDYLDRCPGTPQGAGVNNAGCWEVANIYFDVDKANIQSKFQGQLDEIAAVLKTNPEVTLAIHGHTDSTASDQYNQALSEKRAEAVKQYLLKKGVSADRLETESFGEKRPVASNDPDTRFYNRRVELHPSW